MSHEYALAMKQEGFGNEIGSQPSPWLEELAPKFATIAIANHGRPGGSLKENITAGVIELFRCCLDKCDYYLDDFDHFASQEAGHFWEAVRTAWDRTDRASILEIRSVALWYVSTRDHRLDTGDTKGEVARLVDRYIEAMNRVTAERRRQAQVEEEGPGGLNGLERDIGDLQLGDGISLSHYSPEERALMRHNRVQFNIKFLMLDGGEPQIPHDDSHPLDVQTFLVWTALKNYTANRESALFMRPVMYVKNQERELWSLASGGASFFGATIKEFADFAVAQIKDHGRNAVIGLCHIPAGSDIQRQPWRSVEAQYTAGSGMPREVFWAKTDPKHGVGLLLRRDERGDWELVVDVVARARRDDRDQYFNIATQAKSVDSGEFKMTICGMINNYVPIKTCWHRGKVFDLGAFRSFASRPQPGHSTPFSANFVTLAVQDKIPRNATELQEKGYQAMDVKTGLSEKNAAGEGVSRKLKVNEESAREQDSRGGAERYGGGDSDEEIDEEMADVADVDSEYDPDIL